MHPLNVENDTKQYLIHFICRLQTLDPQTQ